MSEAMRTSQLVKEYKDGQRILRVLRGADLHVKQGEIVSITGASGSGKSTLLHLLAGLDRPTSGSIEFEGRDLSKISERELSRIRAANIGIVFQFYHLLPEFSALENVMIPQLIINKNKKEARERAEAALEEVGLADRANHQPSKLSGGEQQRVAIARALINDPTILLTDEPTGNLDLETGEQVTNLLWQRVQDRGCAMVIVTHEAHVAEQANHHFKLIKGRLEKQD